jgi:Protein of unknown function (DUF2852)
MWWWSTYGPAPWMFFGPMMMFLFMLAFMVGMLFLMRMMGRRAAAEAGPIGPRFGLASRPADRPGAFEQYRDETLRRLDQEQREFQEFIASLRKAKDKAEFEQFMAERRGRSSQR